MVDVQISKIEDSTLVELVEIKELEEFANIICHQLTLKNKAISIVITNSEVVKNLNKKYRNINQTTDVLSFPLATIDSPIPILGEIVIDLVRAKEQAKEYSNSLMRELSFLILHGILHLIGYDHDKKHDGEMRQKEKKFEKFLLN